MPPTDRPVPAALSLRERKKAQTRAAIQRHALRLFRDQGYPATTMEQVAAAADISPSTLYRYFPAKEDLILADDYDGLIAAAFRTQPPELPAFVALREAFQQTVSSFAPEDLADLRERTAMAFAIPEVRARAMDHFTETMEMLAELFAERAGLPADDFALRITAGTVVGAMMAAQFHWATHPDEPFTEVIDRAIGVLISGQEVLGHS